MGLPAELYSRSPTEFREILWREISYFVQSKTNNINAVPKATKDIQLASHFSEWSQCFLWRLIQKNVPPIRPRRLDHES